MNIVERLQNATPYGLEDKTLLIDAAQEIQNLYDEINALTQAQHSWGRLQKVTEAGNTLAKAVRTHIGLDDALDTWENSTENGIDMKNCPNCQQIQQIINNYLQADQNYQNLETDYFTPDYEQELQTANKKWVEARQQLENLTHQHNQTK
jgi:hypothetical protein